MTLRSRRGIGLLSVLLLLAVLVVIAEAQARPFYEGRVSRLGFGPSHSGSQGAGWQTVFRERARGRVAHRVCITHEQDKTSRCWTRTSRADGTSVVFVAQFVNDVGGPGPWHATWLVRGRRVARWDFTVRPEGV